AKDGLYIKSNHEEVIEEGVRFKGKFINIEAEKGIILDEKESPPLDLHQFQKRVMKEISQGDLLNLSKDFFQLANPERLTTPTELEGRQVYLHSQEGNIFVNGDAKANDIIQIEADKGYVTVEGRLSSDNRVIIDSDTGFSLLSKKYLKYGPYDKR